MILKLLKRHRNGLNTAEIAEECRVSRPTILADLRELVALKKIRVYEIGGGPTKIYQLVEG